ncbi:MAG TPA: translocation/assembly module TamB domain-containing protein, partial [Gemmatimonadales bacterium]|nr:translocation/assembly module TamB domain-containing protein [Gemmatimonadales bacterium]
MRRRILRWIFVVFVGAVAATLGVVTALLYSPPGRVLLARLVSSRAGSVIRGSLSVGAVSGRWLNGFSLERVVIKDAHGELLADVPRLEIAYHLGDILAGRYVIGSLRVHRPVIQIFKHRTGRVNYEEIFRLGERTTPGGPSRLVEIRGLTIDSGMVTIRLPWHPDGRLHTQSQVDSALAYERAKPGRRIEPGPEGLEMVRTIEDLNTSMALVRLSSPDNGPTLIDIERLSARISDPAIRVSDLQAQLRAKNDSLLFTVDHAELPATSLSGQGRLDWPSDTILYHFSLQAGRLALRDMRWISPGFPDYVGSAHVEARSVSGSRTEYELRNLELGDSASRMTGRMIAMTDIYKGLGFRRLGLDLQNVDVDVIRPYLDSVPFYGKITGRLGADGFFEAMTVSLDWQFRDAKVPGAGSRIALDGPMTLGGRDGMFFHGARLSHTDMDLRTVRRVAPAVILGGRLGLNGSLTGPWKDVVFDGTAEHRDDSRPPSRLAGRVRLDTRGAVLGLETDVVLDSLSFEGIRRTFPALKAEGALGGRVKLAGTLDRLAVDVEVGGAIGRIHAVGGATVSPPRWGADSLRVTFTELDLRALTGTGPQTRLAGRADATGLVDAGVAPDGRLAVTLGPGQIREFALDSAVALVSAADSVIRLDTLRAHFAEGRVDGGGTIGWAAPRSGLMAFHAVAKTLEPFDSIAMRLTKFTRDSLTGVRMSGSAQADANLEGALGALKLDATLRVDSLHWLTYSARNLEGRLLWLGRDSVITAGVSADTLRSGNLQFTAVQLGGHGHPDSLQWVGAAEGRNSMRLAGAGGFQRLPDVIRFRADTLSLDLLGRQWWLVRPLEALIRDSLVTLDTVRFVTRDGSGSVQLAGDISRGAPSNLSVTALGVELRELYALAQHDTSAIQGTVLVDARVGGTARAPELRGTGTLTGAVFGDFQAPLVRSAFDYRDRVLRSNLTFWRTGTPVVEVDATLPLDLAFASVPKRQLSGPITIVAKGDSVDLALVEAFTPNLRKVTGFLNMDVRVEGTWEAPRLAGAARLLDGGADVPALGVRYGPVTGELKFSGDSIIAENVTVRGKAGMLDVKGGIRMERLTTPVLALALSAQEFELIDVREYLRIQASGDVNLTGTLLHPVLTGAGRFTNSIIYFADLVSKDIVNLEDPLYMDLVDTLAIRHEGLGANFQSRFLDSLTIRDLDFIAGEGVWLRSAEANFQLE